MSTPEPMVRCPVCTNAVRDKDYFAHCMKHQSRPIDTRGLPEREDDEE